MTAHQQLPKYKCHKEVWALKIIHIEEHHQTAEFPISLIFDGDYVAEAISMEWFRKHEPEAGGYFVIYEDGYKSYSPAEAFEAGYTLMEEAS